MTSPWQNPANRKTVAPILNEVAQQYMSLTEALNTWPLRANEDPSVEAAYNMIQAFEDYRRQNGFAVLSKEEIDELTRTAERLALGQPVPQSIMRKYGSQPDHADVSSDDGNVGIVVGAFISRLLGRKP